MKKIYFCASLMIGTSSMTAFLTSCASIAKPETHERFIQVNSFVNLKKSIESNARLGIFDKLTIEIAEDIVITEPIYVMNDTTITCSESHSITRSPAFYDDMFVVGEDENGYNPILSGDRAKLTFDTTNGSTLTIDGNQSSIGANQIYGSTVFITNSSEVNINDNIVIQNCRKDYNVRTLTKRISKPTTAGGSAALIASGTLNMFGGLITNCSSSGTDDDETKAYMGGAIFNCCGFNMYGGSITNCFAARGGALYNYFQADLYNGSISNNQSTSYGGAVYLPDSQYVQMNVGSNSTNNSFVFDSNTSGKSGGAIYVAHHSVLYVLGNTTFSNNKNTTGNGGAINSSGSLLLNETTFTKNSANSKGGAIYQYYSKDDQRPRELQIFECLFDQNTAKTGGGAVSCGISGEMTRGFNAFIHNSTFTANSSKSGGALHILSMTNVEINNSSFTNNSASISGGFLFADNDETKIIIKSAQAKSNTAPVESGSCIFINSDNTTCQIKDWNSQTQSSPYFDYDGDIHGKVEPWISK